MKTRCFFFLVTLAALLLGAGAALASSDPAPQVSAPEVSAWQALPAPGGQPIQTLAASPAFISDHTLFAATPGGIYRSADAGQSWAPLGPGPTGAISDALKIVPSPAYPQDGVLFILARTVELPGYRVLRSTDAGATWEAIWESPAAYDLAVSPNYAADATLFLSAAAAPHAQPQVYRSVDGGDTWLPTPDQPGAGDSGAYLDVYLLAISPNYGADRTVFAAGFGAMHRSTDGGDTWQALPAAGPNYSLTISPNFAADRTLWAMYREIEASVMQPEAGIVRSVDGGASWQNVTAGLDGNYNQRYRSLAPDPSGDAVYLALAGPEWDARFPPRIYRSDDRGLSWAPQELLPGGAVPDQVLAPGPLPHLFALADGVAYAYTTACYQLLADGGFETDPSLLAYAGIAPAWDIPSTANPADYTSEARQAGAWAMRSGIWPAAAPNTLSYSDFRQRLTIPADAVSAVLRFARYPVFGDAAAAGSARAPAGGWLAAGPDTLDYQYVLARFEDADYEMLRSWRDDDRDWIETEMDLMGQRGKEFRLQWGVFNNGLAGTTAMLVDEASVTVCRPLSVAPDRRAAYLPMIVHSAYIPPAPTPTPTRTPTVSPAETSTATPTATPAGTFPATLRELIVAPGDPGALYGLTNSSLLLVSYDRGETWALAPQGVPAAVGRAGLGMDYANPDTLYLGTLAGLFRTDAGGQWQFQHTVRTHALAVEYGRPTTLWAAPNSGHDFGGGVMVIKSDDGGQIWRSASDGLQGWSAANPIIIDPDDPNTLFVTTASKYGSGALYRGTNAGNWRWLPGPPLADPPSYYFLNTGLAFDNGANALYMGSRSPGRLWRSLNANAPAPEDVAWQLVHDFGPNTSVAPLAVGAGPTGPALYINLTDTTDWTTQLLRSDDGGATWRALSLPPGPPPPPSNQYQLVVNGYPATRLIADHRSQDRYATSAAGLHRKIGYNDWTLANNAAPRPKFVYSPADSNLIWAGLAPMCLAGGPDEPMYKSEDGGRTWHEAPAGRNIQPVVAHPTDPFRVYGFGCAGVYLTADGGATWQLQDADLWRTYFVSDIAAVDPAWTTIYASGVSEGGGGMLARSVDGGATWQRVTPLAEDIWWITDVWVDPADAQRVYFVEPKGVWRSLDAGATWQRLTAGLEAILYADGRDPYGLLEIVTEPDDPSRLYLGTAAGLYRGFDYGARWEKISGFSWDNQPVDGLLADGSNGVWLNSPDGAFYIYFGYPTSTPTHTPVAAPTHTPTATPPASTLTPTATATRTPTATATTAAACTEGFANGGFETDAGWRIKSNPVLAGYVTSPVLAGSRSMRTGIAAGGANLVSFSPIEQEVSFPAGAASAALSFWRYNVNGDAGTLVAPGWAPDAAALPGTEEARAAAGPQAGDYFYVLAILPDNKIDYLLQEAVDAPSWRGRVIPLDAGRYAGKRIRFQFGTYNNGAGGVSRTFVDDAALTLCAAGATATATPAGVGPSPTPTPTRTATPVAIPTAAPGFVPTPYWAGQLNFPAGSHPHGLVVSADGMRVYVAFHGRDHSGRTLAVVNEYLSLQAQIDLAAAAQGPNGVALIPATGYVVVANRQTANAAVVNPATGSVAGYIPAGAMPNGVIVHGGYGYIANYGSDTVTVFDPATLAVIRTLHGVGHEPALFAADTASGDVYLSAHGSDQVFVLREGQVASHWDGIPAPYGLSYDSASRRLYVANRGPHHSVTVLDIYHDSVVGAIALDKEPFVLFANPESGHLFIACGDEVKIHDTYDWSPVTSIPAPAGAEEGIAFDARLSKVFVTSREGDALTVIQDQGPGQLLFASGRDGNGEIYRMLPDGRRQVRLTFTADAYEDRPAGSPDGRWIAYERTDPGSPAYKQIWLMSRDGRGATMLTDGPFNNLQPTWSADSRKLAIASDRDGDWEIYLLDIGTRGLTKLTDNTWFDAQPDWSKLTGRIAFVSNRNTPNGELFTMAADGSDVRQLTANINGDASPSWAPGGNQLAFWGSRPQGQGLYTVRSDGSDIQLLVPQSLQPSWPAWGFVGEVIIFSGYRPGSGYSEIMRVAADGSGLVLLTYNETDFDYSPGWLAGY